MSDPQSPGPNHPTAPSLPAGGEDASAAATASDRDGKGKEGHAAASGAQIVVDGDHMVVDFVLPAHSMAHETWKTPNTSQIFPMYSGVVSVAAMCRAMFVRARGWQPEKTWVADKLDEKLTHFITIRGVKDFSASERLTHIFTMKKVRAKHTDRADARDKVPCLRCKSEPENVILHPGPSSAQLEPPGRAAEGEPSSSTEGEKPGVLVHVIGIPPKDLQGKFGHTREEMDNPCTAHVQIGAAADRGGEVIAPRLFAQPQVARVVVVSLWEVCPEARIRLSLSYEAIVLDLLRHWRDYGQEPKISQRFRKFLGLSESRELSDEDRRELEKTWIVVRINSSAALIYHLELPAPGQSEPAGPGEEAGPAGPAAPRYVEEAYLCFHRDRPAPLVHSGMGLMYGYNGIIGAAVATALREALEKAASGSLDRESVSDIVRAAVRDSILWQKAYFDLGLLGFFFEKNGDTWQPKEVASWNWEHCANYLREWQESIGRYKAKEVAMIRVPIAVAVSHRNQWFIVRHAFLDDEAARNPAQAQASGTEDGETQRQRRDRFLERATRWLTTEDEKPADSLPILDLGHLKPVDRREVEDFLALHQAFLRYADSSDRKRPLNIAVFGPPGAGKSFGVKAVAKHIATGSSMFSGDPLTFNFSQFTSLADLVGAFHTVRNECLKKAIPVVFLDEFDSAFEGRPFGWLKYFLAPMQDGQFNDGSNVFELGHCVLVFAGGINRSFEEFNGRLRNPSFVEAKGPDFISRLRAHLNIRGINQPEDEAADQDRYILRRALMLHGMIKDRLAFKGSDQPPKGGFMHAAIAKAFSEVEHFKHGARSLEAILDMCNLQRGRRLSPSDLPSKTQLDMHVDATKFLKIVYDQLGTQAR